MVMVASDLNNPEFAGATNPDSRLVAQFYSKPVKMNHESQVQGRPIFADVDYVRIFVPGDSTSIMDAPVREDHKARFPIQWAHYQNKHGGDAKEIGTPLAQWPRITPAQAEELRAIKFYTVESVANASDANIQRIGMIAGMSPYKFREHAQRFLQVAKGDAVAQAAEEQVAELKAANAKLQEQMAEILERLNQQQAQPEPLAQPEPRKPGRPRKEA